MENTEKMVARGTAWLEAQTQQQTAKDRTIRFVKEMVADLTDGEDLSDAEISLFKTAIKGTRVRIPLSRRGTNRRATRRRPVQHLEHLRQALEHPGPLHRKGAGSGP